MAAPGKWPVVGERAPLASDRPWTLTIGGLVGAARTWSLDELAALPQVERAIDIHCVTRWSMLGARFAGVPLNGLLDACSPSADARFVSFIARSDRAHSTSLPLSVVCELEPLVATHFEGRPIDSIHGGPLRAIVPGRYFYKSVKWLETVELLADDRLGYWESDAGYHNSADPWREERFLAPGLSKQEAAHLLAARVLGPRDLRGLDGSDRDLTDLDARNTLLRDARFVRAILRGARFDKANLSNAKFVNANLRDASLVNADLEGVDFRAADLRGADLRGSSLFGATFCRAGLATVPGDDADAAAIDTTTRIDLAQLDDLAPPQAEFLRAALRDA